MIIAIEGIDGAGKNTLVRALTAAFDQPVHVVGFPRYADSVHAQLAQEALYGRMGDLTDSVYGMATLFALDRHGAAADLRAAQGVVLLDRYVASNAAYSAARLGDDAVMDWVYELEFERLGIPRPDLQIFLDTDVEVASERATDRAVEDRSRAKDRYELDGGLQHRTAEAYRRLAAREWGSRWIVSADPAKITKTVLELVATREVGEK
ncbi:thymidylate kinase [Corynebacterium phocae]|uniref:Thymidylate kinase n=1 Tax=Corynebacterium phocae TaxID=161895 RepID=A0A1L7D4M2_9CORY|nr:dTMP kinase [Corynebacterium phocae]APT93094.1 thymidylate kinase [Corynebacterium phocae]KAA8722397.1 dTMP kinase [Corynebacterium phocae]